MTLPTARAHGLARCSRCTLVARFDPVEQAVTCPRCHAKLHLRKPQSEQRTLAYLLAGYALYLPANLLPIMHSSTIVREQNDTILSGVVYLWSVGSWPLAVIVFVASIAVPLAKLLVLSILLVSVRRASAGWLPERTTMFRVIDFIGRWSMLDIYVLAVLAALVNTPGLASVTPGPAALPFAAVVVVTLLAARAFDTRLMWDAAGESAAALRAPSVSRWVTLPDSE